MKTTSYHLIKHGAMCVEYPSRDEVASIIRESRKRGKSHAARRFKTGDILIPNISTLFICMANHALSIYDIAAYFAALSENEVSTTREVAAALKITVPAAYKLLSDAEKREIVCKYGYRVKGGWDDPLHTNRKCDSLGWQKI